MKNVEQDFANIYLSLVLVNLNALFQIRYYTGNKKPQES